jgi:hypothetical protein
MPKSTAKIIADPVNQINPREKLDKTFFLLLVSTRSSARSIKTKRRQNTDVAKVEKSEPINKLNILRSTVKNAKSKYTFIFAGLYF